jgi:cell wall-associated NlpC family hydrolase
MPAFLPFMAAAAGAAYILSRRKTVAAVAVEDDSRTEAEPEVSSYEGIEVYDELVNIVSDSLGWPYFWGRGDPSTPWEDGDQGVDCSGYTQMVLVRLGQLSSSAPDRNAYNLANASEPVAVGDQRPGDWAYYAGHAMIVAGPPGPDGHSPVIGASGGGPDDKGDNPNARIKMFRNAATYGPALVTYCRIKR